MHVRTSSRRRGREVNAFRQEWWREEVKTNWQIEWKVRRWSWATKPLHTEIYRNSSDAWIQWTDFSSINFIFQRNEWLKQFKCVYIVYICRVGGWQCMCKLEKTVAKTLLRHFDNDIFGKLRPKLTEWEGGEKKKQKHEKIESVKVKTEMRRKKKEREK